MLFWSTVATAFKLSLQSLDVYQLLLIATVTSTATLFVVITVSGRLTEMKNSFTRWLKPSLAMGFMNPFLYYLILFEAYNRLPAQIAQPINYTWAIVLTFLSILVLKQKISRQDILAAFICYSGVLVISFQGQWELPAGRDYTGISLALLSTLVWAGYWILNIKDARDPVIGLFLNFLVSLPLVILACAFFSDFRIPTDTGFFSAIYIGLFEMSMAFLSWSLALKLTDNTSKVSNLIFLSPFLSLVLVHYVLGEEIYSTTYAGLVLIVSGLILQRLKPARHS